MKKIVLIILIFWGVPALAEMKSATLTASGLTCSMCSKAIYKALLKVPFIKDVQVNIQDSKYTIQFREGSDVVLDDVKKAVEDAGFSVASFQVTAAFNNVEVYNDAHITVNGIRLHFLNVPKQQLEGDKTFTVVDKDYLPVKDFKRYGKYTQMKCFETGRMASCCPGKEASGARIYHVTL